MSIIGKNADYDLVKQYVYVKSLIANALNNLEELKGAIQFLKGLSNYQETVSPEEAAFVDGLSTRVDTFISNIPQPPDVVVLEV